MKLLNLHENIENKLDKFLKTNNVPNLIFYGPPGSGKKVLVQKFINKIYETPKEKGEFTMKIDCEFGNGIKFIRNELKIFAKSNIIKQNCFKTIILINADKLTFDAQSALRRSIELYSSTTRFFMVIRNINSLLKPMISRFSKIYVGYPLINKKIVNLYKYFVNEMTSKNDAYSTYNKKREIELRKKIKQINKEKLIETVDEFYNKGYSCYHIIISIKKIKEYTSMEIDMLYFKLKKEILDEKLLMYNILFLLLRFKE